MSFVYIVVFMYTDESVTVRIPKSALVLVNKLKARKMLFTGKKVSDGEILKESTQFTLDNEEMFLGKKNKKPSDLSGITGIFRGSGRHYTADEIDEIAYERDSSK